jgi:6-pyruvoyl-tetrahydropterin synthase related domain
LYLTGLLSLLTGWQVLDILRILPALISTLTIPAFFVLAREVTGRNMPAALGTLVFAMIPRTFDWLIMGGGITRSFGLLFAVLALWQGYKFLSKYQAKELIFFIFLVTLVVYSHLEAAVHVTIGMAVFYLVSNRSRKGFIFLAGAAIAVAILTAAWWAVVAQRYGLDPFLAASAAARQDGYNPLVGLIIFFRYYFTDEPFTAIFASIGLIGMFRVLAQRNFLLPVWFFTAHLLEPRGGTLYMMLPLSMAAGIALDEVILPAFSFTTISLKRPGKVVSVFLVLLFFYGTFSANYASSKILTEKTLHSTDLNAFDWVRANSLPKSRFLIITGESALGDPTSEWFPAITLRRSQATIFGYEWVNDDRFSERAQLYTTLQDCAFQDVTCIEQWSRDSGLAFDYIYIRKLREGTLIQVPLAIFLRQSPQYKSVYASPEVEIFEQLIAK